MSAKMRESFDPIEFTYPSNILSLVRLAMVGPTIYTLLRDDHGKRALALIALGMLTDLADGPLARRRGEVSELGKLIDPIADKLMLDGVALALSIKRDFPWWVTNLLLARDAAILLGALLVFRRTEHITTAIHVGKLTTALLTVTLLLYLLNAQPWARRMLNLTMIPFAISWVLYGTRYLRSLRGADLDLPSS
ncbi:CDP-alcohol phosphatidyltransferase family protein [Kallotenue papyrolyticum]|uniref:CDP-alcohol phosphatidyltransferase family protein n=1 Tax=Kallotenue papyrolyticum TaxID=1325125 RepID=UPI00047858BF|nr:CDP-alcohol phosphatidyltransferase family protein [Kallotenue papyrolyticum]